MTIKRKKSFSNPYMLIVKAIIQMGQSLDMTLLAVAVETSAQRNALIQSSFTRFQGYLLSKPKPINE